MGGPRVPDVRPARPRLRGRVLALPGLTIRPLEAADRDWADAFLAETLGGRMQARRAELVDVLEGSGLVAELDAARVGVLTWLADGRTAELRAVAIASEARGRGVGRELLRHAEAALRSAGVAHAWLITTNDNLSALALYQKEGWRLAALRVGALDEIRRRIKPSLPAVGEHGIPLRDELELVKDVLGE